MTSEDDIEVLRNIEDPIERGRRAGQLLNQYQQSANELARMRREAIEMAHEKYGLSYTTVAGQLGLTKGRISQIRTSAPSAERAFFGVGPVTIIVPERIGEYGRRMAVVSSEDDATAEELRELLSGLHLRTTKVRIPPETTEIEKGDVVLVCGPKSAPVGAILLETDPRIRIISTGKLWEITDLVSGLNYGSPMDTATPTASDVAYLARRRQGGRVVVHIAGIHATGSVGVAKYLTENVADLFKKLGDVSFSMIIGCSFEGTHIASTRAIAGPYKW